ncbi:testis-specific protein TSX-like isoform X2 [Mesocricetus auratus]|nr:testis-specific protein TSX-like isoform X2 [Mesocricetus auratus]
MSEEQTPQTSEAERSTMDFPEFEDEERWFFKVLGIKPRPSLVLDNGTNKKQEDESLGHTESFLHLQGILQENKINSTDDSYTCQAACTEEDDETNHSDSDMDDNVKVIIGNIKTNPSMYMEMLNNLNLKAEQDEERTASDNAMNPTE